MKSRVELQDSDRERIRTMIGNILDAQQELDELAFQLSLGNVTVIDKFEEIKAEFRNRVAELRMLMQEPVEDAPADVFRKLNTLDRKLSMGRAEDKIAFNDQRRKITAAIHHVENELVIGLDNKTPFFFAHEAEKFRLKLEILKLHLRLRKFEVSDGFRDAMKDARKQIQKLSRAVLGSLNHGKAKYIHLSREITKGYSYLKRAVKNL